MRVRLGDVCEIINGFAFKSEKYVDNGMRIIRITNVQNGYIEDNSPVFYPLNSIEAKKYELFEGDILISLTGNVGRVGMVTDEFLPATLNQRVGCLRVNNNEINEEYLFHFLNTNFFEQKCIESSKGIAQKNMSTEWLKNYEIKLLPMKVQKNIVNTLNKINNLIESRQQQLKKLDELVKSRFIEMFGDPLLNPYNLITVKLGTVLAVEPQNGLYKPQSDYVVDKSGIPILRIDSFYNGQLRNLNSLKRLNCSDIEKKRYLLKENDIVINRVNSIEYLGKCALITGLIEDTLFESNMMRLHVDETKYNPVYVTYLLCSKFIYNQILSMAKKAVNQASINQKDVENFEIYMPNLNSQNEFADFVKQTDKSKLEIQKSLDKLEILKKSLMQQYFG